MTAEEMRILTVRQPWAWAIIHGGKDVENRVRNIAGDYRGPVAIHAGLEWDQSADSEIERANPALVGTPWLSPWPLPGGAIIGVVDLFDVHPDGKNCGCRSNWAERGVWHLCVRSARQLPSPIPFTGALGLRRLDPKIIDQIESNIA